MAGSRVRFGSSAEVAAGMDPHDRSKLVVFTPSHPEGAVDIAVINPNRQTGVAAGVFAFVPPGSFNVDGDWSGGAITGHEDFSLSVVDGAVVSISCWTSGTVTLSPPAVISDGEFTFSSEGIAISGRFDSPSEATGVVTVGPCIRADWYAVKR